MMPMRHLLVAILVLALLLFAVLPVEAAPHPEVTVVPVGPASITRGNPDVSFRLPMGPSGALAQPIVLVAVQPRLTPAIAPDQPEDEATEPEPGEQVPCTLKFSVADRELPPWVLTKQPTAYVINVDLVKANPQFAQGRLALKVDAETAADTVEVTVLGMPDPMLLDPSTNGPLVELAAAATDAEVKEYLQGLEKEIAGDRGAAKAAYEKLRTAKNERVARLARRGLRMYAYQARKHPLSGNLTEHLRWGLYLRQSGFYSVAFAEFEEARIIMSARTDAQFYAGEMFDRLGGGVYRVLDYMNRTGEASGVSGPSEWYVLVPILKKRGEASLTFQQVRDIEDNWLVVERMVWAASGGHLRLVTSFYEIEDERQQSYVMREDGYYVPTDDLVEVRGWFDGVISVVPRLPNEAGRPTATFGGDVGPNGAVLSCLFSDSTWQDFLDAGYEQFSWTATNSGMARGMPLGGQVVGCGPPFSPHIGYASRAALRYHFTPAMLRRLKQTDTTGDSIYVQLWELQGPIPISAAPAAEGSGKHHVLDPISAEAGGQVIPFVAKSNFIDLAGVFPNAGPARVRATSWVYSPATQEVRMWLGANDGIAVWINGRCVPFGEYYPSGKLADCNLLDTVASWAELKQGWNEVRVVVESLPAPRDQGWGFALRFCTQDNKPIPGLAAVNVQPEEDLAPPYRPPAVGPHYAWPGVKYDWREMLPELKAADLEALIGIKGMQIAGSVDKLQGFFAMTAPGRPDSPTYRSLAKPWQAGTDRDFVLNNILDWEREACAAVRYQKDSKDRDLLFVKPEALEAYTMLLDEPASAAGVFGGRPPAERLLGYVVIPSPGPAASAGGWTLFVLDTLLSDKNDPQRPSWPLDEEDLLTSLGPYIPNATLLPMGPLK